MIDFKDNRVIPVVKIDDASQSCKLAEALLHGGINCIEITFRTEAAYQAIKNISDSKIDILLGAGTVTNMNQLHQALDAGAKFIISPGISIPIAEYCQHHKIPYFPGISSATEIQLALEYNIDVLKFFPAEAIGGLGLLKSLSAVYSNLKFIPTGGINISNIINYLKEKSVMACGGSWLVTATDLKENDFSSITNRCREVLSLVNQI